MTTLKKYRNIPGYSFIEMISTVVIMGIVSLGMMYIFTEINLSFNRETKVEELRNYANYAVGQIAHDLRRAENVSFSTFSNYQKIIIDLGDNKRVSYSASPYQGVLKNGEPINYYRNFDIADRERFQINNFSCKKLSELQDGHSQNQIRVLNSTYRVEIILDLLDEMDENTSIRTYSFAREAFSPTVYLRNQS
jgi:hypothetical protein